MTQYIKALTISMLLIAVTGCGESQETNVARIRQLGSQVDDLTQSLNSCKARVDLLEASNSSTNSSNSTDNNSGPTTEPEKRCDETDLYVISSQQLTQNRAVECREFEKSPCGLSFWKCDSKEIYECVTNVKYTITTKEVCE